MAIIFFFSKLLQMINLWTCTMALVKLQELLVEGFVLQEYHENTVLEKLNTEDHKIIILSLIYFLYIIISEYCIYINF